MRLLNRCLTYYFFGATTGVCFFFTTGRTTGFTTGFFFTTGFTTGAFLTTGVGAGAWADNERPVINSNADKIFMYNFLLVYTYKYIVCFICFRNTLFHSCYSPHIRSCCWVCNIFIRHPKITAFSPIWSPAISN